MTKRRTARLSRSARYLRRVAGMTARSQARSRRRMRAERVWVCYSLAPGNEYRWTEPAELQVQPLESFL